jgi:hypothetical protein
MHAEFIFLINSCRAGSQTLPYKVFKIILTYQNGVDGAEIWVKIIPD